MEVLTRYRFSKTIPLNRADLAEQEKKRYLNTKCIFSFKELYVLGLFTALTPLTNILSSSVIAHSPDILDTWRRIFREAHH